jgi:uncharacterized protein YdgA (DUF945 family)
MKKLVAVGLLVALLAVAPWGIGKVAEQRVNQRLDQLIEVAPYLGIVERKYTRGWFRSEQEVTFEVLGPLTRSFSPKVALAEAILNESARRHDASQASGELPTERAPDAPQPLVKPLRFTVRNEILHGPVLGLSGVGVARVDSRLALDAATRKEIVDLTGTDEPVRVSTRIGFFGVATTTFSGEARTVEPKKGAGELSWDDFELDVSYTNHFDSFEIAGDWPRLEINDKAAGTQFLMSDMTIDGKAKRVKGDLYDTDLEFAIDKVRMVDVDQASTEILSIRYVVNTQDDGDFMSVATRIGTGKIKSTGLEQRGLELNAVHNDFTLRRLHTATLVRFMAAIRDSYTKPALNAAATSSVLLDPITEQAFELLKHDPEFVIDRIGIETPEGEGYLKGVIRLKGVTEKDLKMGALSLIAKIDADLLFEAPQKMLEKIEGGSNAINEAVDGGFAERKGDKLVSHLEFHQGELKINGKVQGIPGLGAPAPGPE